MNTNNSEILWKIGDTSWRKKNQIGLYNSVLSFFFDKNSDSYNSLNNLENFWKFCINEGLKQKISNNINKDSGLLFKTLINFNLINKNQNIEVFPMLNGNGIFFYNLTTEQENTKDVINDNNKENIENFLAITINEFSWIFLILKFNLKQINEWYINKFPFFELFSSIVIKNYLKKEELVKFHLSEGNKKEKTENEWEFRKPPKNKEFFIKVKEIMKTKNKEGLFIALEEMVKKLKSSEKIRKIFNLISWYELKRKFNKDNLMYINNYFKEMSFSEFNKITKKYSDIITAEDEYLSITNYWLENLNIFNFNKNNENKYIEFKSKNIKFLFSFLLIKKREQFIKILEITNLKSYYFNIIKLIEEFFRENKLEKIAENNVLPFNYEFTLSILKNKMNFDEVKNKFTYLEKNIAKVDGLKHSILYEYFINLFIWYSLDKKFKVSKKMSFKDFARTKLNYYFFPEFTAPGNGPDGFAELEHLNIITEITTHDAKSSLIKNEIEPIKRHALTIWKQNNKTTFVLFFTKNIYKSFLQYLFFSFDSKKEFIDNKKKWMLTNEHIFINPILINNYFNNIENNFNSLYSKPLIKNLFIKSNVIDNDNFEHDENINFLYSDDIEENN
ncbi:hypothetical protein [Mycoplasma sp. 5370]